MQSRLYPCSPLGDTKRLFHRCDTAALRPIALDSFARGDLERIESEMSLSSGAGIDQPHENDVLMGRGGKNNQHSGNEKLRQIARTYCVQYYESSKKEKSNISRRLVDYMRDLDPPARFLKRDALTGQWDDVGDDVAREKASQVLRDAVALVFEQEGDGKGLVTCAPPPVAVVPSSSWGSRGTNDDDGPPEVVSSHSRSDDTPGLQSDSSRHHRNRYRPVPSDGGPAAARTKRPREGEGSCRGYYDYGLEERPYAQPPSPVRRRCHRSEAAVPLSSHFHPPSRSSYSYQHHYSYPNYHQHHHQYPQQYAVYPSRPPQMQHRRRSSATDGSSHQLLGDALSAYGDFDLFNGQLLESDSEDRG